MTRHKTREAETAWAKAGSPEKRINFRLEKIDFIADSRNMERPYFTNAPQVTFVGGDPELLLKCEAVELGVWGDNGLLDRLNHTLLQSKSGIYGFPVKEEILQFGNAQLAA